MFSEVPLYHYIAAAALLSCLCYPVELLCLQAVANSALSAVQCVIAGLFLVSKLPQVHCTGTG